MKNTNQHHHIKVTLLMLLLSFYIANAQYMGGCNEYYGMNNQFPAGIGCCPTCLTPGTSITATYPGANTTPCPGVCTPGYTYHASSTITCLGIPWDCSQCTSILAYLQYTMVIYPAQQISSVTLPNVATGVSATINGPTLIYNNSGSYVFTLNTGSPIITITWTIDKGCSSASPLALGQNYNFDVEVCLLSTAPPCIGTGATFNAYLDQEDPVCVHHPNIGCASGFASISAPACCSLDPNAKSVYPTGCTAAGIISKSDSLQYTVHFQNTGSADAYSINIFDTLDTDLDTATFKFLGGTFPTNYIFLSANVVEFVIQGFTLPPASVNANASQGLIMYQIKPKTTVTTGTEIKNTAAIIFDDNPAVITNQTLNTIGDDPLKQVTISPTNKTICAGSSTTFTASAAATYLWSTGATTQIISANATGNYTVSVTYNYSCPGSAVTHLAVVSNPTVDAGVNDTIYVGYGSQSATLTATGAGGQTPYTYNWSTSATTQSITVAPTATTKYYVTLTDSNGCTANDSVTVLVINTHCNGTQFNVCYNDTTRCVDSANVQTYLNLGATMGSCPPMRMLGGNIALVSKDYYLHCSPNPAQESTDLVFNVPKGNIIIQLLDSKAQLIETLFTLSVNTTGVSRKTISTKQLAPGTYYIQLRGDVILLNERLVIQ